MADTPGPTTRWDVGSVIEARSQPPHAAGPVCSSHHLHLTGHHDREVLMAASARALRAIDTRETGLVVRDQGLNEQFVDRSLNLRLAYADEDRPDLTINANTNGFWVGRTRTPSCGRRPNPLTSGPLQGTIASHVALEECTRPSLHIYVQRARPSGHLQRRGQAGFPYNSTCPTQKNDREWTV